MGERGDQRRRRGKIDRWLVDAQAAARLKEAQKLGFARAVVPEAARSEGGSESGLSLQSVTSLATLVADIAASRTTEDGPQRTSERRRKADVG